MTSIGPLERILKLAMRPCSVALFISTLISSQVYSQVESAADILNRLGENVKIYAWPTQSRSIEFVGDGADAAKKIIQHYSLDSEFLYVDVKILQANVSIYMTNGEVTKDIVDKSRSPEMSKFAHGIPTIPNGCLAVRFTRNDILIVGGGIIVDRSIIGNDLERCVTAGLDYINGMPTSNGSFRYKDFPPHEVSVDIIRAIYGCIGDQEFGSDDTSTAEDVRRKLSFKCVASRISSQ